MRLKYNFIGLILACGLGLSSCNDSFLDRNPKDQLSDASFWKNAEDAQKFATGIYLYLIEPRMRKLRETVLRLSVALFLFHPSAHRLYARKIPGICGCIDRHFSIIVGNVGCWKLPYQQTTVPVRLCHVQE